MTVDDTRFDDLQAQLREHGQEHLLRFWDSLDADGRAALAEDIGLIDFPLMERLIETWVRNEPAAEKFNDIQPVPLIPKADLSQPGVREAWEAGEEALRAGKVGLFLVAGGQGTRLGFPGPKGAYPIGPVSQKSLFAFHAEKMLNIQQRYGCVLPWYIMVSRTNHEPTKAFFEENGYFGLNPADVKFFPQRMVPCVDQDGRFMLDQPHRLAMNPNGHGGCIPAAVESGAVADARERGVSALSYFQVDNLAVKVADPLFIGYHMLRNADMSSKNHSKNEPREAVGVHCICDGVYHVIEYSELDIYPQLLETDEAGKVIYNAGNPAIHILSVDFIEQVYRDYDQFPWHRAHKKVPFVDEAGQRNEPEVPNAYKFETFVFDALRFINHEPVALEIGRQGEYTPIKQYEGSNSVVNAWASMGEHWAGWLEAAGCRVPRDENGKIAIRIEISPQFALYEDEFVEKARGFTWPEGDIGIDGQGRFITPEG